MLGYLIGDRNSQDAYQAFQTKHGDAPETLLIEWKQKHPYASWTLLYQGLKTINEVNLAEKIKETYLSGMIIVSYLHLESFGYTAKFLFLCKHGPQTKVLI